MRLRKKISTLVLAIMRAMPLLKLGIAGLALAHHFYPIYLNSTKQQNKVALVSGYGSAKLLLRTIMAVSLPVMSQITGHYSK